MSRSAMRAMSGTVKDATRFTATAPHAHSRFSAQRAASAASGTAYKDSLPSHRRGPGISLPPGPPGETPKEKVERLRAAHRAAQLAASTTTLDRIIDRGRLWADRAHRTVTWFLIGTTGVVGLLTVFSLVSLGLHSRTQQRAFIERELNRLYEAQIAVAEGTATEDQLHLVRMEHAGDIIVAEREERDRLKKERSLWTRMKGVVGLAPPITLPAVAVDGEEGTGETRIGNPDVELRVNALRVFNERVEATKTAGEKAVESVPGVTGVTGGPLDVMAGNVIGAVKENALDQKGWRSWIRGN